MRINIWSDIVCPWCYIGKRRLETALADFPHADEVEIQWHSYLLDPTAPAVPTETVAESLGRKYGGGPQAGREMISRVVDVAAQEGMAWRYEEAMHVSTVDAHRLLHLAFAEGGAALQGALKEALFDANFGQARNIGDPAVLTDIATSVGLVGERVSEVLQGTDYAAEVEADVAAARAYGATGVPFYVVDEKYGVSGAQPAEVFTQVLERAWADSRPSIDIVASGEECGPDGCAI